jgi:lipopolysaccharide biosynthesis protein
MLFDFALRLWRLLPLTTQRKRHLKNCLFQHLPLIFGWTKTYQSWQNFNAPIQSGWVHRQQITLPGQPSFSVSEYVPLLEAAPFKSNAARLICFYLPQFHPIPENEAWWGEGFTEWTNVEPAQPLFDSHYQPRVPGELGYYSLLDPAVQRRQVELAKLYGIYGFCIYFYWFAGKRLLEAPIQNYLNDRSLDLPFCLCWANENWSRRWDGLDSEILIAQNHSAEDDVAFIAHVAAYMRDPRYIRIDGKPLLLVYRPSLLPSAKKTAARWRSWCRSNGIGEIYLAYTQSFETAPPANYGFDAAIEFPPNNSGPPDITGQMTPHGDDFSSNVFDWRVFIERSRAYKNPGYELFRGVCPSWDNTARRKNAGTVLHNSSPRGYQEWLFNAIANTCDRIANPDNRFVFINAWNEWAEGAYLEPDQRYGYAYLEATRLALLRNCIIRENTTVAAQPPLAIVVHAFYEDVFEEILNHIGRLGSIPFHLYVTCPLEKAETVRACLVASGQRYSLLPLPNRGRDVLPFFKIMPTVIEGGHRYLIKVHTKKSVHRQDGDTWRSDLFDKLLTDSAIRDALEHFKNVRTVGILGPEGHVVPMSYYWGSNAARVEHLSARLGIDRSTLKNLSFVAGTMFFARTQALLPLMNLAICEDDFEEELHQVDGTMAHAIERVISVGAKAVSLDTRTISEERKTHTDYPFAEKTGLDGLP